MKKIEFETSKGRFLLNEEGKGISLKEITEEQATEIVDEIHGNISFITTLNILIKSKGIHLFENPIELLMKQDCNCDLCQEQYSDDFKEFEQKTFYNPYIFKIK